MTWDFWLDVAWKSGLVAGVALAASLLFRGRAARDRVAILRLGLVLIAALPVMALALPDLRIQTCCASVPAAPDARIDAAAAPSPQALPVQPMRAVPIAEASPPAITLPPVGDLLMLAYLAGLAALLAKLALGLGALQRWTRRAAPLAHPAWTSALDRASGGGARPLLKVSPNVASPLSWGWRPSVILVHPDCVARPEQAAAVLEHEMAHVRRGDWPMLILCRVVVAALWFNPLVWLLTRELARQSELAADEHAVQRVNRTAYAQALVTLAGRRVAHAGLSMAGPRGELADRVRAVLSGRARQAAPWSKAVAALACLALATPLAALEVTEKMAAPLARAVEPLARAAEPVTRLIPVARDNPAAAPIGPAPQAAQAADTAAPSAPGDDEAALRLRGQSLAMMEIGAGQMEQQARHMRAMAESLPAEDRPDMIQEAVDLENEARALRNEASDLAASAIVADLRAKGSKDKPDGSQAPSEDGESLRAEGDVRIFNNRDGSFRVEADQLIHTAGTDAARSADAAAAEAETTAEDPGALRRRAGALRRQAEEIEAQAARLEHGR